MLDGKLGIGVLIVVFGICHMEQKDTKIPPCCPLKPRIKTTAWHLRQQQFPMQQFQILDSSLVVIVCLATNDYLTGFLDHSF